MAQTTRPTDVCIVGSGLTGLLLGAGLTRHGMKVILLEGRVPHPQEADCTGILPLLPFLQKAEFVHGTQAARTYAATLLAPLSEMTDQPPDYLHRYAAYLYAAQADSLSALKQQQALLSRLGLSCSIAPDAGGCPFPIETSLHTADHLLVDLPRWMTALRRSVLRGGGRIMAGRHIRADVQQIVFTGDIPPGCSAPLLLERRRLVHGILKNGPPLHSIQLPVQDGLSLFPCRDGMQFLWDAGRFGTAEQQRAAQALPTLLRRLLPDWQQGILQDSWTLVTADGLPLIGTRPGSTHLFAAGEAGILGAMHAASVLMRYILGQTTPEDRRYSPDRPLPAALLRTQRRMLRRVQACNLLRMNAPSCSYCSCRMRYSRFTDCWECPSCSSAFDMFGQALLGPASHAASISVRQRPVL